jgi:hypothetical protein
MNAVTDIWSRIFNTGSKGEIGGRVSPEQCATARAATARAVFGDDHPAKEECDRYKTKFKALAAKQADEIIGQLQAAVNGLAEEVLEIDERIAAVESAEWEKRFLAPRMTSAMFSEDPAASLSQIGRKPKVDRPAGAADWIDTAQRIAGKDAERRRQGTKNQPLNQKLPPGTYRRKFDFE